MEIYMIRHGTTVSNRRRIFMGWREEPLDPEGLETIHLRGRWLSDKGIGRLYSSPIRRALQTARIINRYLQVPIHQNQDLGEIRLPVWEGLSADQVQKEFPEVFYTFRDHPESFHYPGMESPQEVRERAVRTISRLYTLHPEDTLGLVTHQIVLHCLAAEYAQWEMKMGPDRFIPNAGGFLLKMTPAGTTLIPLPSP